MSNQPGLTTKKSPDAFPPQIGRPGGGPQSRFMPKEKARDARGTFRKLLRFYIKEGKSIFIVIGFLMCDMALALTAPYIIGKSINVLGSLSDLNAAYKYAAILLGIYAGSWALQTTHGLIMNSTSQRIVRSLRKALFDKFQKLPLTYHDAHTHGELMSRITNDIDNISVTIAQSTAQLISAVISVTGSLTIMIIINIPLTLAALVTAPFIIVVTRVIAKKSRKMFVGQQNALGRLNGEIEESIGGQKIIKAFNMEQNVIEKFQGKNSDLLQYAQRAQIWSGFLMPFMNLINNAGYVSVAFAGGLLVVKNVISVGLIGSFSMYSRQFVYPLNNIAATFNNLQSALAGAERVFEVLAEADEPEDVPGAVDIGVPKGDVRFENVTFAYTPGVNVLKNVSFEVKAGLKVALVGATGAGKTTIVNLLSRFYDATEGTVYIDGLDIKNYKRDSLRRAFSVVLQNTCLFTGTIADNIRYGRPEATDEEIEEAAKTANADEFIRRLKNGYETVVSGETDALSQGQRQLLAISRAALCRSPILILDEATSSVDTRTERRIQEALLRLSEGRTSFVIAHRLSTIRNADVIMVVDDGEIVESGTHDELIAKNGLYARMHYSQYNLGEAAAN